MKKINTYYWIFTGLWAAMMLFTAIPNIIMMPESVDVISKQLGYPEYFVPYIGVVKVLGIIAILIPGYPRVTEWAYAGLFFDLASVVYSTLMMGTPVWQALTMLIFILPGVFSYIYYHKRLKAKATA